MTVDEAITQALKQVGELLTREAKANIRGYGSVRSGGGLFDSIDYEVDGNEVTVGSNLFYAIYYEMGTGMFAANGNGSPTPWYIPIGEGDGMMTEETAEFYHFLIIEDEETGMKWAQCYGAQPHPFLLPALNDNRERLTELVGRKVSEALGESIKDD